MLKRITYEKDVSNIREFIAVDKNPRTAIDIATTLYNQGYRDVTMKRPG